MIMIIQGMCTLEKNPKTQNHTIPLGPPHGTGDFPPTRRGQLGPPHTHTCALRAGLGVRPPLPSAVTPLTAFHLPARICWPDGSNLAPPKAAAGVATKVKWAAWQYIGYTSGPTSTHSNPTGAGLAAVLNVHTENIHNI